LERAQNGRKFRGRKSREGRKLLRRTLEKKWVGSGPSTKERGEGGRGSGELSGRWRKPKAQIFASGTVEVERRGIEVLNIER